MKKGASIRPSIHPLSDPVILVRVVGVLNPIPVGSYNNNTFYFISTFANTYGHFTIKNKIIKPQIKL